MEIAPYRNIAERLTESLKGIGHMFARDRKLAKQLALRAAISGVEALAGAGQIVQARKVAKRILTEGASAETKAGLGRALERVGYPELMRPKTSK